MGRSAIGPPNGIPNDEQEVLMQPAATWKQRYWWPADDKPKKGKYRHRTAIRCIKPWRGKYKPRQK